MDATGFSNMESFPLLESLLFGSGFFSVSSVLEERMESSPSVFNATVFGEETSRVLWNVSASSNRLPSCNGFTTLMAADSTRPSVFVSLSTMVGSIGATIFIIAGEMRRGVGSGTEVARRWLLYCRLKYSGGSAMPATLEPEKEGTVDESESLMF